MDLNAERVKVGEAPGVELNLAKIELARSQRNEQEFERRYRGATASLNLLMGRPPAVSVIPTSDFAAPLSLPPDDELLDYGLQHRPEVLAADSNVEARTNAVRLARALPFPEPHLRARATSSKTPSLVDRRRRVKLVKFCGATNNWHFRRPWPFRCSVETRETLRAQITKGGLPRRLPDTCGTSWKMKSRSRLPTIVREF